MDQRLNPSTSVPPTGEAGKPVLTPTMLPSGPDIEFKNASFFARHSVLPSPEDVCAAAAVQHPGCNVYGERPLPVKFVSLGLIVKFGSRVHSAEGQCLWAMRHLLPGRVPVPEIYGWKTEHRESQQFVFLYMELVAGITLEAAWPTLSESSKLTVTRDMASILAALRSLRQAPNDQFVGE